jgi:hypothetical protein
VVAVFGLARGSGVTTVSRALALELAGRGRGSAAVRSDAHRGAIPLASPAATRLACALSDVPGAETRAAGRLCLVQGADHVALADTTRHHAPLVLDLGGTEVGGVAASVADHVVVVAAPQVEPALCAVAAACLARVGPEPLVVLNRAGAAEPWNGRPAVQIPSARAGAKLALAGWEPRGELGAAVARLADLLGDAR